MINRLASSRGMTLLEVLVGMAIAGVVSLIAYNLLSTSLVFSENEKAGSSLRLNQESGLEQLRQDVQGASSLSFQKDVLRLSFANGKTRTYTLDGTVIIASTAGSESVVMDGVEAMAFEEPGVVKIRLLRQDLPILLTDRTFTAKTGAPPKPEEPVEPDPPGEPEEPGGPNPPIEPEPPENDTFCENEALKQNDPLIPSPDAMEAFVVCLPGEQSIIPSGASCSRDGTLSLGYQQSTTVSAGNVRVKALNIGQEAHLNIVNGQLLVEKDLNTNYRSRLTTSSGVYTGGSVTVSNENIVSTGPWKIGGGLHHRFAAKVTVNGPLIVEGATVLDESTKTNIQGTLIINGSLTMKSGSSLIAKGSIASGTVVLPENGQSALFQTGGCWLVRGNANVGHDRNIQATKSMKVEGTLTLPVAAKLSVLGNLLVEGDLVTLHQSTLSVGEELHVRKDGHLGNSTVTTVEKKAMFDGHVTADFNANLNVKETLHIKGHTTFKGNQVHLTVGHDLLNEGTFTNKYASRVHIGGRFIVRSNYLLPQEGRTVIGKDAYIQGSITSEYQPSMVVHGTLYYKGTIPSPPTGIQASQVVHQPDLDVTPMFGE
ncbi:prepilin-type N-terminal cleavage/methylation domain-containing protein [Aureibacillus halotolerans]|uniref:Prepilin-type N-terminal cleavage/methylation domain-containing protein n=1 Tax=Aureibacillus halotolerans TaxID=1508390 RepID=A0A4R6TXL5_9BACI|nr:prepilin-type N-terminal cleavage/methylation domain-containing protein [Aureibacillus halotolerans]TDQ38291.1 prepilin-type N-terminal cleavage/methylation domain-containing protein [Aureibacillus halotolerans]